MPGLEGQQSESRMVEEGPGIRGDAEEKRLRFLTRANGSQHFIDSI